MCCFVRASPASRILEPKITRSREHPRARARPAPLHTKLCQASVPVAARPLFTCVLHQTFGRTRAICCWANSQADVFPSLSSVLSSSRMATKEAKPDGQFCLPPEMAMRHMGPLLVQVRRRCCLISCTTSTLTFVRSFIHSHPHARPHSFIHSRVDALDHIFSDLFTHQPTGYRTHPLIWWRN